MNRKSNKNMSVSHKSSILAQSRKKAASLSKKKGKLGYLQSLKDELKKVSWTSKEELTQCTKVVVGATVACGIGIYIADLFIRGVMQGLTSIVKLVGG